MPFCLGFPVFSIGAMENRDDPILEAHDVGHGGNIPTHQDVDHGAIFLTHKDASKMIWDFSWIIWSVLVSPKMNNIGFGAQGHVRKSRNH